MAEKRTETARSEEKGLARREPVSIGSPFRMLDRFAEEMDRLFDDFGFGRGWIAPRLGFGRPLIRRAEEWLPDVEMLQRNNELVIRADLPGMTKDDVKVDVTEDAITIQGERKREHEEEKAGVYRSERSYGSFYRSIPLPEGAMGDLFATVGAYLPFPSPLAEPPILWGSEAYVRELFDGARIDLDFERDVVAPARFESAEAAVVFLTSTFGPLIMARQLTEVSGDWPELRGDLTALYERDEPLEYLVVIGRKEEL